VDVAAIAAADAAGLVTAADAEEVCVEAVVVASATAVDAAVLAEEGAALATAVDVVRPEDAEPHVDEVVLLAVRGVERKYFVFDH